MLIALVIVPVPREKIYGGYQWTWIKFDTGETQLLTQSKIDCFKSAHRTIIAVHKGYK